MVGYFLFSAVQFVLPPWTREYQFKMKVQLRKNMNFGYCLKTPVVLVNSFVLIGMLHFQAFNPSSREAVAIGSL